MKTSVVTPEQCTFLSHKLNSVPCDRCGRKNETISLTHNGTGKWTKNVHIYCECGRLTGFGKLKKEVLSKLRRK